jgi:hypothetical protein
MTFFAIGLLYKKRRATQKPDAECGLLVADSHGVFSVVVVADGALLAQGSSCPAQGHVPNFLLLNGDSFVVNGLSFTTSH